MGGVHREVLAGITTFLTMSYIVVVNPSMLSTPGTGIPFSGALTATVLVCFTMTLLMGVYAKLPFGVAPGMGLNAFFAFTLIINGGIPWPVALGSTFIGVAQAGNLVDERGDPKNLRQGLIGGRTGLTAVVTACCFLPCLFIAPVAAAIPPYATAAVLILVGASMFHAVTRIPFDRLELAVPAYVTLILIPLTFSITQGILWGFILHAALYVVVGRARVGHHAGVGPGGRVGRAPRDLVTERVLDNLHCHIVN